MNLHDRLLAECEHWPRTSTLDALLCEAAAFVVAHSWQPIETAPRDGREVILARNKPYTGRWDERDYGWKDSRSHYRDPTHWMPMPMPPSEAGSD